MRFFLCREARVLLLNIPDPTLLNRMGADQALLIRTPTKINLREYPAGYQYITEQFVTRDYPRNDLLQLAHIVSTYEPLVIKVVGDRCKALKHFNLPYLIASLDAQASEVIEELRREERIEVMVAETTHLELPPLRPSNVREKIEEIATEQQIDTFLRDQ